MSVPSQVRWGINEISGLKVFDGELCLLRRFDALAFFFFSSSEEKVQCCIRLRMSSGLFCFEDTIHSVCHSLGFMQGTEHRHNVNIKYFGCMIPQR